MFKKYLILLLLILLPLIASAQNITTTTCPGAGCIDVNTAGQGSIGIQVTGTWVGTITFQASLGTQPTSTFVSLLVVPSASTTAVSTTTGNGAWSVAIAGYNQVRVVFTAYTSGTAVVNWRITSQAKNNLAPAATGGTVTSVGLALPTAVFDISGSPVTTTGTLTGTFDTQTANTVFSGPTTAPATTPTFRALVAADIPTILPGGTDTDVCFQDGTSLACNDAGFKYNKTSDVVSVLGAVSLGVIPSTTGAIRLTNNTTISSRNAANDGDIQLLNVSSGSVTVGDGTLTPSISFNENGSTSWSNIGATYTSIDITTVTGMEFWAEEKAFLFIDDDGDPFVTFDSTDLSAIFIGAVTLPNIILSGSVQTILGSEVTAPSAPDADGAVMFFRDSGGGKTQACARFNSGAIQCFATEP